MSAKIRKRKLRGAYLFTRRVLDPFCTLYLSLIQNENTFVFVFVFLFLVWETKRINYYSYNYVVVAFLFSRRKNSIVVFNEIVRFLKRNLTTQSLFLTIIWIPERRLQLSSAQFSWFFFFLLYIKLFYYSLALQIKKI